LVAACCIGNVKLGQGTGDPDTGGDNIVIHDVYLLTLLRKSKKTDTESQVTDVKEDEGGTPRPQKARRTSRPESESMELVSGT
jgi:hypothetical protein